MDIGIYFHVEKGMENSVFLEVFENQKYPGSKLDGPYNCNEEYFGGPQRNNLNCSYVYFIIDSTGCPMHRFFFSDDNKLLLSESIYHEWGTWAFW